MLKITVQNSPSNSKRITEVDPQRNTIERIITQSRTQKAWKNTVAGSAAQFTHQKNLEFLFFRPAYSPKKAKHDLKPTQV